MAEKSGFFNAKLLSDSYGYPQVHEDGSYVYDREYTASEFADLFSLYLTNGIRNGGTNLKVMASGGLYLKVYPGDAMVKGYYYRLLDEPKLLSLNKYTGSGNRIDRIVLRLDLTDKGRQITIDVKQGLPAAAPLTRNNEIWELCLAEITVPMNWEQITDAQIRDTRLDNSVCGLINSRVEVDTTLLLNQIDTYFEQKKLEWNATSNGYNNWYQNVMNNWLGWFNQIKMELFSQMNTIFDDWSRHGGYNKEIEFLADASGNVYKINEKLYNYINLKIQATRVTEFPNNTIKETLVYTEPSLTVIKTTSFEGNKIIEMVR